MTEVAELEQEALIVVGDRVDLVVKTGQVYRALIEDRQADGPFLLAVPSLKGIPMHAQQDDDIYLVFYRESGRYIAQMSVIGLEKRGETRYMWLLQKTPAQRNQRRDAYRLPVSFNVQIFELEKDSNPGAAAKPVPGITQSTAGTIATAGGADGGARAVILETADSKDISVTGIALITKKQYTINDKFILAMKMGGEPINPRIPRSIYEQSMIKVAAAVRRSIPWRISGRYNTGMQFMGMSRETNEKLSQFVLTEQQRQIKMRRRG